MLTRKIALLAAIGACTALGVFNASADEEEALEMDVVVKLTTRTPDGVKTKLRADGALTLHEDDGDFDIAATTSGGDPVTLSGTLGIGRKGAYGMVDLTTSAIQVDPLSAIVKGKLKGEGHSFKANVYAVTPEFSLTTGTIRARQPNEHGHEE